MSLCISCQNPTQNYKCPKCVQPYCSLNCYQAHKESGCAECVSMQATDIPQMAPNGEELEEPTLHDPFTTEDTVPREKLEELRNAEGLLQLLHNPHLRNLLREVDVAPSAWRAIRAAMQEPLFVEFADECLKVVEPMTAEEEEEQRLMA